MDDDKFPARIVVMSGFPALMPVALPPKLMEELNVDGCPRYRLVLERVE